MILGIGNDIVSVSRVFAAAKNSNGRIFDRILSKREKIMLQSDTFCQKNISFLSRRFAAKESFFKALGTGAGRGLNFNEVSIVNDSLGKPMLADDEVLKFVRDKFSCNDIAIHFSISDEKEYANAVCIIENIW